MKKVNQVMMEKKEEKIKINQKIKKIKKEKRTNFITQKEVKV